MIEITCVGDECKQYVGSESDRHKANELFEQDRCNYCFIHDYFYKNACKRWMETCFPDFIDEDEMMI